MSDMSNISLYLLAAHREGAGAIPRTGPLFNFQPSTSTSNLVHPASAHAAMSTGGGCGLVFLSFGHPALPGQDPPNDPNRGFPGAAGHFCGVDEARLHPVPPDPPPP